MTIYDDRPWLAHYPPGLAADLPQPAGTLVDAFRATLARTPDAPSMYCFDDAFSFREVDRASDAFAAALRSRRIGPGDHVTIYLQNDPQFVVAQLGIWKVGATMVSANPMLKADELEYLLNDSRSAGIVTLDSLYADVASDVLDRTSVRFVATTGDDDGRAVVRAATGACRDAADEAVVDMRALMQAWDGTAPPATAVGRPDDIACIGYTSGTSGRPKGVMNSHASVLYNAEVYRRWFDIGPQDVFVCGAPLFHITGLVAAIALGHYAGTPMILFHRFDGGELLRLTEKWRGTSCVMAITAYRALLQHPDIDRRDLSTLTKVYSGGAPVSQAASDEWEAATGSPIHNIYGLTETASPSHAVPLGVRAPVDEETAAMSIGIPVPGAEVRVVDPETLKDQPAGDHGEILIKGPMVTAGYWEKPEANETSFHEGYLRTGDVGKMDADGWFYVVDRLKDIINAAGYKVSPREVEDCLVTHPAVFEAAVIGIPDEYRGETVKAFVTLRDGQSATPEELIEFSRQRLAAYKYPRSVEVLDELPKTTSGKILRRELRPLRQDRAAELSIDAALNRRT